MSTIFLENGDFEVKKINGSSMLCTNMKGIAVVMFYSTQCSHCHNLIPIFKQLPRAVSGCQFGMANIDLCRDVITLSKETIDPITYVPYIVFYANRRPIMKYSGPHNINEIVKFVTDVAATLKTRNFFQEQKDGETSDPSSLKKSIPAFTIGVPCEMSRHKGDEAKQCEDDVCYLSDITAYKK